METKENKNNEQKTTLSYYLAWIAIISGVISVIHNHLSNVEIPKKTDYTK